MKYGSIAFIISASLGAFLEYLDYTLYAYAAPVIAVKFFPDGLGDRSLILTWLIFAISFVMRIIGSLYFGSYADRFGCRLAMLWSLSLMSCATVMLGFIPTYETIGFLAPLLLLICRSLQSFAVGPEYSSLSTYLLNLKIFNDRYCFISSISVAVAGLGMLTGGYIMAQAMGFYTPTSIPEWHWRLPFILSGLLVGGTGIIMRFLSAPVETISADSSTLPLTSLLKNQGSDLFLAIAVVGLAGVLTYTMSGFIPYYLREHSSLSLSLATDVASNNFFYLSFAILLSGYLADKLRPERVLMLASIIILLILPLQVKLMTEGEIFNARLASALVAFVLGFYSGSIPSFLSKLFSKSYRYSGSSLGYNLGMTFFGGITPLAMMFLFKVNMLLPPFIIAAYTATVFIILFCKYIWRPIKWQAPIALKLKE